MIRKKKTPASVEEAGAKDQSSTCINIKNFVEKSSALFEIEPDFETAQRSLSLIDPTAKKWTFQLFHDREKKPRPGEVMKNPPMIIHDSLEGAWKRLLSYNRRGYGIFVSVNETDFKGRKTENIVRVRAVFQELDAMKMAARNAEHAAFIRDVCALPASLPPSIEIESSPGNRHNWLLCDGLSFEDYAAVQNRLIKDHASDKDAKDLPRVLRVPGFFHCKNEPVMVRLLGGDGRRYSRDEIIAALPPIYVEKRPAPSIKGDMALGPATEALLWSWIAFIPGSEVAARQAWLEHGWMLVRLGDDWFDDKGDDIRLKLWETLSRKADGYEEDTGCAEAWEKVCGEAAAPSGSSRVKTFRTLQLEAERAGWTWENSGIDPGLIDEAKIALKEARGEPERLTAEEMFSAADAQEKTKAQTKRFELIPFDAIKINTAPAYRIKGILPDYGLCVVWGPPKCGKSFLVFDMVMHVALSREYRGRKVRQGSVVYCALEGCAPFKNRIEAFRQAKMQDKACPVVPFHLMASAITLVTDHKALIASINLEDPAPAIVVIDTLNRSLAGSESSDEDMSDYVKAADAIRDAFNCLVIVVHHCGHEGTRPRGHSSLLGALDCSLAIKRDVKGDIVATVELMKDGLEGDDWASRLRIVTVGLDDEGDGVTSCVIDAVEGYLKVARPFTKTVPRSQQLLVSVIEDAIESDGVELKPSADGPPVRAVDDSLVRQRFYARVAEPADTGADLKKVANRRRQAFNRAVEAEIKAKTLMAIERDGGRFLWLP